MAGVRTTLAEAVHHLASLFDSFFFQPRSMNLPFLVSPHSQRFPNIVIGHVTTSINMEAPRVQICRARAVALSVMLSDYSRSLRLGKL